MTAWWAAGPISAVSSGRVQTFASVLAVIARKWGLSRFPCVFEVCLCW
jgi:hypothetical protein